MLRRDNDGGRNRRKIFSRHGCRGGEFMAKSARRRRGRKPQSSGRRACPQSPITWPMLEKRFCYGNIRIINRGHWAGRE